MEWDVAPGERIDPRRPPRRKLVKPRLPWRYPPRQRDVGWAVSCGNKRMRWPRDPGAQVRAAWFAKNCGVRKTARQFDPGGPESGTLVGARRAPGLFDEGWGEQFPLTRAEQRALQEGRPVLDPFFAPPTTPHPSSWIEDKLQRLRGTFAPSVFTAPKSYLPFCPPGESGITCAGPNAEVVWRAKGRDLTAAERARFTAAYCVPGVCVTGPTVTPPADVTERFIFVRPRNPAVAVKASCQPQPQPGPVVQDRPTLPAPPAGPPVVDWSCAATEAGCMQSQCIVGGQLRQIRWKVGVPPEVMWAWLNANCF